MKAKKLILASILSFIPSAHIWAKSTKTKDVLSERLHHLVKTKKKTTGTGIRKKRIDINRKQLIKTAKKYLGTRYVYGANSRRAVDCSSFVQQVYKKNKKRLPRTSREQARVGKKIPKSKLRPGDLVFFSSKRTRGVAHVGIYIGSGKFIHASSAKKKVVITKLNKKYYRLHYKGARRV